MAAQGSIRDKILRVSMPFEKGRNSARNVKTKTQWKRLLFGNATDTWSVVLKVRSWATQLREGKIRSCAEIARMEGITRTHVSQLWPLCLITKEQAQQALSEGPRRDVSLQTPIRFARDMGEFAFIEVRVGFFA